MATPLLTTKHNIPPLRHSLVRRPRLLERLNQGLRRKLTLLSAPAGFGKTTLLVEWIQGLQECDSLPVQVGWLSLDSGDDDPARFYDYLATALQSIDEGVALDGRGTLEFASALTLEPHIIRLINQVAARPHTLVLVLDDYHLIGSQAIHDGVAFLVDHLPENMHLAVATRGDPPLPLARLRARGELTELRQSDLRFTAEEAAAFLHGVAGLNLSPDDVSALERRTEGWIAGLRLASLAARGRAADARALSAFVQEFTGSHRFILDYLLEEVLDQQPAPIQEFLLRTSVLERLTGPLCDAVMDKGRRTKDEERALSRQRPVPDGQSILEYLDENSLFILPLDDERRWYRYHRLFSDLLRKRLLQVHPDLAPALHRRASAWYEAQGLAAAAIDHALAAEDHERAATLIENHVEATFMRSEIATIQSWVDRLPDELLRRRPTLCFYHAWALLLGGRSLVEVEERLGAIDCADDDATFSRVTPGRLAALRAYAMLFQADMQRTAELCRQALETLPEGDLPVRSLVTWMLGLVRLFDSERVDGLQELEDIAATGQQLGNPLVAVTALCYQARLQARQGRLHRARDILERALHLATGPGGQRLPIASEALIVLGMLLREWNDLEAAADHLVEAIELAMRWSEPAAVEAYGPLALVRAAQGDVPAAHEAIEAARTYALRSEATEIDDHVADLHRGRLLVALGDAEGAARWAEARGLVPAAGPAPATPARRPRFIRDHLPKYEHEVLARLYLLQARPADALELLESLLAGARQRERTDLAITIQALRAIAFDAQGEDAPALEALDEALCLAEPGGYVRVFLDEGPTMARLLRQAAAHTATPTYVARLLAAFECSEAPSREPPPQPLIEPLSERELEVLGLLARGLSNPEIADQLFIALSTVRSHCKSIYAKLEVHKRWDAVQRARDLALL